MNATLFEESRPIMSTQQEATPQGYTTPVQQFDGHNSLCCHKDVSAVYFNPYNRVVQCHNCGHVWEPKSLTADSFSTVRDALVEIRDMVIPSYESYCGAVSYAQYVASSALAAIETGEQK